ncbi:MAG: hypothetical protein ACOC4G_10620 [Bacillota bacterium]
MDIHQVSNKDSNKEIPFLIAISYFFSFIFIRLAVLIAGSAGSAASTAAKTGELNFYIGRNIILFGYHIHHFYFGIALIIIAGWISINDIKVFSRKHAAIMYGIGLGLFMDEIGLLLTWGNYYSSLSYILSLFLGGVFLNIVFFPYFWLEVKENLKVQTSSHWLSKQILSNDKMFSFINKLGEKTRKTEKTTLTFMGILYIIFAILILFYPTLVYYWIALVFILQGISSLIQAWNI